MNEVEFKDRVPKHPGRIKLFPVEGQPDTFTMERADEPIEPGTPINKAALDGIMFNRLTGRYYELSVSNVETSLVSGITTNPLPTSGWVISSKINATNGQYRVDSSDSQGSTNANSADKATDGNSDTCWTADNSYGVSTDKWWSFHSETPIKVNKLKISLESSKQSGVVFKLQGRTEYGNSWKDISTNSLTFGGATGLKEYTIDVPGFYKGYRIFFPSMNYTNVNMYDFRVSNYDIATYINHFALTKGVPDVWVVGQRITVQVPSSISSGGIVENTLNGIKINTILQVSKRYELVYNGTTFDAKEV